MKSHETASDILFIHNYPSVTCFFRFLTPQKLVNSHSFTYQYLTTKEGLSNQRVFSIIEDKKGFIWISTRSGVDCFNGRNVKNYNLFGEDIIVDGAGRMIYLTKDSHENLWAYTSAGKIFKYDSISDSFTLEIDVAELTESGILQNDLFIDSSDHFWFRTEKRPVPLRQLQ